MKRYLENLFAHILMFGFMALMGAHILFIASCATAKTNAVNCAASSIQAQDILNALGKTDQAAAIAALDGLKFAECMIVSELAAYIGAHQVDADARAFADADPLDAVRVRNARAWLALHT